MSTSTLSRVDALEVVFGDGDKCPVCRTWTAVRMVGTDSDTGAETSESRPAECPRCGRTPTAELQIVGMDIDDLP